MTCTCSVADSFNVRVSDLINPSCPEHGCKLSRCPAREITLGADRATSQELLNLVRESMQELQVGPGHYVFVVKNGNFGEIARNLLSRYDIRRKR